MREKNGGDSGSRKRSCTLKAARGIRAPGEGGLAGEAVPRANARGQESSPAENSLRRTGGGYVQVVVGRWCEGSGGDEGALDAGFGGELRAGIAGSRGRPAVAVGSGGARMLKQSGRTAAQTAGRRLGLFGCLPT
jgi:hypothetical protein